MNALERCAPAVGGNCTRVRKHSAGLRAPKGFASSPPNSQAGLSIISATYGHDQVLDRPFSAFPIDIPISSNLPAADGIQPSFSWLFQARMIDIYSFFIARTMRKSTDLAS